MFRAAKSRESADLAKPMPAPAFTLVERLVAISIIGGNTCQAAFATPPIAFTVNRNSK